MEDGGDQSDGSEEVGSELVVTCGGSSELLHFLEETLDQIALFVKNVVAGASDGVVGGMTTSTPTCRSRSIRASAS